VVDLRRLRYFIAVANERNFTRAAERLHVAQPALSRQLRLLEQELGVDLMRRTTHTFELTDAGRYLLEHAPRLIDEADALWRTMHKFGSGEVGRVTVAYGTSAGYDTAPQLLRAIARRLPDLDVSARMAPTADMLAALGDGSVDIAVVRCPPAVDGIESRLLRLEPQGVLIRCDHPLAKGACVRLADLRDESVLLHPREANPGHYDAIVALLTEATGSDARLELRDLEFDLAQTPVREGKRRRDRRRVDARRATERAGVAAAVAAHRAGGQDARAAARPCARDRPAARPSRGDRRRARLASANAVMP
jgi:DNA-binding transcriptional LysR family regulator